ncbi:hypothetical protein, partial [Burkholderia arboris]|uniref:hypothetical protein n=1 Tax=Burkholderia arboris TaxID=488730 RepID=UPI001CF30AEC
TLGDLLDCFDLELIRVPLAAHTDLLGCHKLWLEDVYERLAGPVRANGCATHTDPLPNHCFHRILEVEDSEQ